MYKYRDYFPRSVLNKCGVSPELALNLPGVEPSAERRQAEALKAMSEIYSVFLRSAAQKVGDNAPAMLYGMRLDERIVSAFYDADVLQAGDKAVFPEDYRIEKGLTENTNVAEERINIEVPESEDIQPEVSQKIEESAPPQPGKTLS